MALESTSSCTNNTHTNQTQTENGSLYYLWEFILCKVHVGDIVDLRIKEGDDLLGTHGVDHKPHLGDVVQVSTVGRGLRDRRNYWSLK